MLKYMHILHRYSGLSTHTFIQYIKREKLSFSFRVTPGADIGLVGDSGSDSPPRNKTEYILVIRAQPYIIQPILVLHRYISICI